MGIDVRHRHATRAAVASAVALAGVVGPASIASAHEGFRRVAPQLLTAPVVTGQPVVVDHSVNWTWTGDVLEMLRGERQIRGKNARFTGPPIKDLGIDKEKDKPAATPATPAPAAPVPAAEAPKQP